MTFHYVHRVKYRTSGERGLGYLISSLECNACKPRGITSGGGEDLLGQNHPLHEIGRVHVVRVRSRISLLMFNSYSTLGVEGAPKAQRHERWARAPGMPHGHRGAIEPSHIDGVT